MPPKKDVPVKKPTGLALGKPVAKPALGSSPAKTKSEPGSTVPEKSQDPPLDLSKVVVSLPGN